MKKNKLAKALGIMFLVGVLLTWLIPVGVFQEGKFILGKTDPFGFIDIIRTPFSTIANFVHYGLTFLVIGGLYGVLNKTGVYSVVVNKVYDKYKDNKEKFIVTVMLSFILFSSLVGINTLAFVVVPFALTILLKMNFSKLTALAATIGSILVGSVGATYSSSINTPLKHYFPLSVHSEIFTKIIFLIIVSLLFITFVINRIKEKDEFNNKKGIDKIPLYKENINKNKSHVPLVIITVFGFILLAIGMFDWGYSFGIEIFKNIHEAITTVDINGYPIFRNIVGGFNPIGKWTVYDLTIVITLFTALIAWVYSLSLEDTVDSFIDGMKEILPVALYVTLANILFTLVFTGQTGANIFNTIANSVLGLTSKFNFITMSLTSIIGSLFFNDFIQMSSTLIGITTATLGNSLFFPVAGIIMQFMYGLTMFVVPTSLILIAGLSYLEVSYKEWISYIWKYLLQIFAAAIAVIVVIMLFV